MGGRSSDAMERQRQSKSDMRARSSPPWNDSADRARRASHRPAELRRAISASSRDMSSTSDSPSPGTSTSTSTSDSTTASAARSSSALTTGQYYCHTTLRLLSPSVDMGASGIECCWAPPSMDMPLATRAAFNGDHLGPPTLAHCASSPPASRAAGSSISARDPASERHTHARMHARSLPRLAPSNSHDHHHHNRIRV